MCRDASHPRVRSLPLWQQNWPGPERHTTLVMVRRSPFSPILLHRRRPRPATLELTHSTFISPAAVKTEVDSTQIVHITENGPYIFRDGYEDDEARASAELAHTQAVFTASLEHEPIPCVRARSPTAYRAAGKVLPMEVEAEVIEEMEGKASLDKMEEFKFPLPTGGYKFPASVDGGYQFPAPVATAPRVSIGTNETTKRGGRCFPVPWLNVMRVLRAKGRRRRHASRQLPEPVGFHERITHAEHEWRPTYPSCAQIEDKGTIWRPNAISSPYAAEWPWR